MLNHLWKRDGLLSYMAFETSVLFVALDGRTVFLSIVIGLGTHLVQGIALVNMRICIDGRVPVFAIWGRAKIAWHCKFVNWVRGEQVDGHCMHVKGHILEISI